MPPRTPIVRKAIDRKYQEVVGRCFTRSSTFNDMKYQSAPGRPSQLALEDCDWHFFYALWKSQGMRPDLFVSGWESPNVSKYIFTMEYCGKEAIVGTVYTVQGSHPVLQRKTTAGLRLR